MSTMTRNQELILIGLQRVGENRRQAKNAERIASIEISELARKGVRAQCTVQEIAYAAGVTRQTIYSLIGRS